MADQKPTSPKPDTPAMEPKPRFEEIEVSLSQPVRGRSETKGVLGLPGWWPTGDRIAVVLAHGSSSSYDDPLIVSLAESLTKRGFLTLRFNFPFAEAGKRNSSDSDEILQRCYRAALNVLGRDPTALPVALFVGGVGIGGRVAASLVADRLHADGLFLLGFPLHPQDKPALSEPDVLFRGTAPMLFVQGTRDRRCDGTTLRNALRRVGAPIEIYDVEEADSAFHAPKKSDRNNEQIQTEIFDVLAAWLARRLR